MHGVLATSSLPFFPPSFLPSFPASLFPLKTVGQPGSSQFVLQMSYFASLLMVVPLYDRPPAV